MNGKPIEQTYSCLQGVTPKLESIIMAKKVTGII
ncbi:MAG: hypothetical protein ACJAUL_003283, partial [Paraglaciecola sp.]